MHNENGKQKHNFGQVTNWLMLSHFSSSQKVHYQRPRVMLHFHFVAKAKEDHATLQRLHTSSCNETSNSHAQQPQQTCRDQCARENGMQKTSARHCQYKINTNTK